MIAKLVSKEVSNGLQINRDQKVSVTRKCHYNLQTRIVSEYDQEIPQSQTADNPVAPQGRAAQPSQDTRKTN